MNTQKAIKIIKRRILFLEKRIENSRNKVELSFDRGELEALKLASSILERNSGEPNDNVHPLF